MLNLKSSVIKILEVLVSKPSPIESSIVDKMAFRVRGSVEGTGTSHKPLEVKNRPIYTFIEIHVFIFFSKSL